MIQATDLKVGTVFEYQDEPCKVLEYKHTHLARSSADVRLKIQGLQSGTIKPAVFAPSEKFPEIVLNKKEMQFLYQDEDDYLFMDPQSFEQMSLSINDLKEKGDFLKDGEIYELLFWEEKPMDLIIPPKIDLTVIECDPGVKGNSAANMYKSAVLEGNIQVRVPLFIKQGERVRIDTVNRKYVERAK